MDSAKVFFATTKSVTARLGEFCNFIWASTVAMWHLRQQVQSFLTEPKTAEDLRNRFVSPAGVASADLNTTCLEWSWEELQEQIAKMLLFNVCSVFEAWLDDVVPRALPPGTSNKIIDDRIKGLQFPTTTTASGTRQGFREHLAHITAVKSSAIEAELFPVLKCHKKNAWSMLESMLKIYRYFKECRNKSIHQGGIADAAVVNAYTVAAGIEHADIGLGGQMKMPSVTLNDPVRLALPDVVALTNIVHRMIVTMDAALAVAAGSEHDMLERIRAIRGQKLVKKAGNRDSVIKKLVRKAGFPEPISTADLEKLLVANQII